MATSFSHKQSRFLQGLVTALPRSGTVRRLTRFNTKTSTEAPRLQGCISMKLFRYTISRTAHDHDDVQLASVSYWKVVRYNCVPSGK